MKTIPTNHSIKTILTGFALVMLVVFLLTGCDTTDRKSNTDTKTIQSTHYRNLLDIYNSFSYDWNSLEEGVPPLLLRRFPTDMHLIKPTRAKKTFFFQSVLPMALLGNKEIEQHRAFVENIFRLHDNGRKIALHQHEELIDIQRYYKVKGDVLNDPNVRKKLLKRIDIIPPSLTLAQAREHMESMDNLGVPIGRHAVFRTSGSSGEPAVIVMTSSLLEFIFGLSLARLTTRQLLLEKKLQRQGVMVIISGGNGHFAGVGMYPLMQRLAPRLARELTFIPAEQAIEATVAELNALENVTAMLTYPSMLSILTREKEAGRLKIEPKLFKVAGETFTPELRERVLRVFPSLGHGIVDVYGCT